MDTSRFLTFLFHQQSSDQVHGDMSNNDSISTQETTNTSGLAANKIAYSPPYANGLTFLYILIIVTCLTTYVVIILTVYVNRRLRTTCNYFIVSLGIADVMIVTMVMPVNIGFLQGTFRFTSSAECAFLSTVNLISISAVSLNLCTVSLDRYFAIAYPFKYEAFATTKTTALIIGAVWLYAFFAAVLPPMGWHSQPTTVRRNACVYELEESYVLFLSIGSFFLPAFIMVSTNVIVYRIATNQAKRVLRIVPVVGLSAEKLRKNFRAAKRISLIVGAYLICWVPHMVLLVLALKIGPRNIPYQVYPVTLSLQYSCSAVNPCMFCLTNRELRSTLKKMLCAALHRRRNASFSSTTGEMALERRRSTVCRMSQTTETSLGVKGESSTAVRTGEANFDGR